MAIAGAFTALTAVAGCGDLSVPNLNSPDQSKALSDGASIANLIGNSFASWFNQTEGYYPAIGVSSAADELTSAYGNFGMRFEALEPRGPYLNIDNGSDDSKMTKTAWSNWYATLGSVNDGLNAIKNNGGKLVVGGQDQTDMMTSLAYLIQGGVLSDLGLTFDQAAIVDETSDPTKTKFSPQKDVIAAALAKFDKAIASTQGKSWSVPQTYDEDLNLNPDRVARLAASLAARTLLLSSRTAAQNSANDWAKILSYAQKGISTGSDPFDFNPSGTLTNAFGSAFKAYVEEDTWTRVDTRIVHLMDPTYPEHYPTAPPVPPTASSPDARFGTDYVFIKNIPFDPSRGYFFFSNYAHKRWVYLAASDPNGTGPIPDMLRAENDLMIAEALVHTNGDLNLAASLVNKTRVGRGKLPAVTAAGVPQSADCLPRHSDGTCGTLLDAIMYERRIDLYGTGPFNAWGDRRRTDDLQPLTFRILPVPASELQTLSMPVYTFGGPGNPDGGN
jgi:hypothetical protein